MKRNNLIPDKKNEFLAFIKSIDEKRKFIIIYSFSALFFILLFLFGPGPTASDTNTNFSAGEIIASGKLDALRTPVYPLILNLTKEMLTNNIPIKMAIIIGQYLLFCLSIFYFYRICEYFISSKIITFLIVFVYACHPAILIWQKIIMAESLALTGVVSILYFVVGFLHNRKSINVLLINLLLFLLVMLRPVFLFMIPIFSLFWIYFILKKRKAGYIGLGMTITVIILILGYCSVFQKQYGVFSISTVSDINQYMMLRDAGLVETKNITNLEFKDAIADSIQLKKSTSDYFDEFNLFCSKFGYPEAHKIVIESIRNNFQKYIEFNLRNSFSQTFKSHIGYWDSLEYNMFYIVFKYICIPFIFLYLFLIFYLYSLLTKKLIWKKSLFVFSIAIISLISIIIGAPSSWGRLIVPTIPILLIMIGQTIEILILKHQQKNSLII